ncbi:MAG: glycosyltransferase family 4 protein [bacterium]|nr:glycosyltransferase family 4 protein [bacterium]
MRILLVTPFLPRPDGDHGGGVVLGSLARGLAKHAEIGLAAIAGPQEEFHTQSTSPDFSWLGTVPGPPRPAGWRLLPQKLRMLWRWRTLPLVAGKIAHVDLPGLLQRARREFQPDVAFVEMAQLAQFLPALRGLPTVFTDHEAGCPANTHTGLGAAGDRRDQALWWRFVDRFFPLADQLQALTAQDSAVLRERLGRDVATRGAIYLGPDAPIIPNMAAPRALFFGDYEHGPNPEAARHLATAVLPRVRERVADAELWFAGRHSQRIADLESLPGVRLVGFVDDLRELLAEVRVLLAPVFSGAGLRTKCVAALAHGLPVVTNELGGRGIEAPEPGLFVAGSDEDLANRTIALLESPELAASGGRAGFAWTQENVSVDAVARRQIELAERTIALSENGGPENGAANAN